MFHFSTCRTKAWPPRGRKNETLLDPSGDGPCIIYYDYAYDMDYDYDYDMDYDFVCNLFIFSLET